VIIFASYKFVGFVIHPFKRLRDEARRSGRLTGEGSDDVSQLIASYEEIINDLRVKEHELEAQMNMILEMSGGLAHQLRNSIGGIVGLARLIQKRAYTDKITSDNVEYLMRESQEAETLVSRFMDFARPLQLYEENFRLSELLKEIVRALVRQFEKVSVIFDHDDQTVFKGDRLLLKQALTNVMVNAAQAFGAGDGEISVKTDRQSARFVLTIADNGPGIPAEYRDKIFTPFVSGSPSGTGLGLALARKIIIALDGRIEFDSQIGIGTEFHFIFPESRLAVEAGAQQVSEAVS
jgi:signal transduction histidine kinase